MEHSFNKNIANSIVKHWNHYALGDLTGKDYTYAQTAQNIAKFHLYFKSIGIKPGDKIALCGRNTSAWAMTFLATVTYGAVAVPILNEFKPDNIHHLVNHSDSVLLFVDNSIWQQLEQHSMPALRGIFDIADFNLLQSDDKQLCDIRNDIDKLFNEKYPDGISPDDIRYYCDSTDELMIINYTSGSTGFSKGVMLTYGNLMSNAQFAIDEIPYLGPDDGMLSILPMAHMYGLLVELIFPFMKGAHIRFLGRVPSPKILLDAFAKVKPKIVITVPLVIEKIITGRVLPVLHKPLMRIACAIPGLRDIIFKKILARLIAAFGGNLVMVVIGGAALAPDVEKTLRMLHFPYTVGYGMTECAPLIAYAAPDIFKERSCGITVTRMHVRIDSPDPANIPGELWVSGANVMKGYYKNSQDTDAVFNDGWMNTGDMCTQDHDGFIYIKGRSKTMILGPSGQNIYPEEIESQLNHYPLIAESIIVDRDGHLVALVTTDDDSIQQLNLTPEQVKTQLHENIAFLNKKLPGYARIASIEIMDEPFQKTPKHSIKRYMYK